MCLFIVPYATSCRVYHVFDPSFSQSVHQSWFSLSAQLLKNCWTNVRETVVTPPFELRNLAKIKYTTVTVCQCNSSKPLKRISWKFVVDKDILCTWCAYLQKILTVFDIFLRGKYTILCNLCETGLLWLTEKLFNQISFWQWISKCYTNGTIITYIRLCFSVQLPITYARHCH